jgi:ribosomal protein L11 methyltransferase
LRGGPVERVLDAGTGSGILAIAAALMGCRHIDAFDFDPLCMETAAENMRRNGVEERIDLSRADIREGWKAEPYDIVVANLFSHLLVDVAPALMSLVRGHLVLTGILEHEGDYVADAFMRAGGREIMRDGDGEWCGILIASGRHS